MFAVRSGSQTRTYDAVGVSEEEDDHGHSRPAAARLGFDDNLAKPLHNAADTYMLATHGDR